MAFNQEYYARINIRNHPEWRNGYEANTKGENFPEEYAFGYTPEYRLGWLHAEEDSILSKYKEQS